MWVPSLGQEDPLEESMQTNLVFLPGESHGQRSVAGYSLWSCKESDMTEVTQQAHIHTHLFKYTSLSFIKRMLSWLSSRIFFFFFVVQDYFHYSSFSSFIYGQMPPKIYHSFPLSIFSCGELIQSQRFSLPIHSMNTRVFNLFMCYSRQWVHKYV